jgi:hypothetical protein
MNLARYIDQPRERGRAFRDGLRLTLGALALAGLTGTAVPRPASAAATNAATPLQLIVSTLHANHTTGEWGKDEPYLVLFSADLSTTTGPAQTQRTEVFHMNAKGKNTVHPDTQLWAIAGGKAPIADTEDVLVLAALMENDGADPNVVQHDVDSRVRSVLSANRTLPYASLVSKLRAEMDAALEEARKATGHNHHDEQIGATQSLSLTPGNVLDASSGRAVQLTHRFTGHNANYDATFTLRR